MTGRVAARLSRRARSRSCTTSIQRLLGGEGSRLCPGGRRGSPQDKQSGAACLYIAEYLTTDWTITSGNRDPPGGPHARSAGRERVSRGWSNSCTSRTGTASRSPFSNRWSNSRPENLQYRVWLMHAYFKTRRAEAAVRLLRSRPTTTSTRTIAGTKTAMAMLGGAAWRTNCTSSRSIIYQEIALHQRTAPPRHRQRRAVRLLHLAGPGVRGD